MSASQGEFDFVVANVAVPTSSLETEVDPGYSVPRSSPFAKGQPSTSPYFSSRGHAPERAEAMNATMMAAQERMEDDEPVVDPAQWPNPEHQQLERIAAYKKGNTHQSYWKITENGNPCLYIWLQPGPSTSRRNPVILVSG